MTDPIKDGLKKNKFTIDDPTDKNNSLTRTGNTQDGFVDRMFSMDRRTQSEVSYNTSDIAELEGLVKEVNKTQKKFEVLKKSLESPVYGTVVGAYDAVRKAVNKNYSRDGTFQLYSKQIHNVRDLNKYLLRSIKSCESTVNETRENLENLVKNSTKDTVRRNSIEEEIPKEIKEYESIQSRLDEINRNKDPEKFGNALLEVIDAQRKTRKQRAEWMASSISEDYHRKQVENLMKLEDIFERYLYSAMLISLKTELYQQALESNKPIFENVLILNTNIGLATEAIDILTHYNGEIQDAFSLALSESESRFRSYNPSDRMDDANRRLTNNQNDIINREYNDARRYERE